MKTENIIHCVTAELGKAETKFKPFNSMHEGYSVIHEELDELWQQVKANDVPNAIDEAIQIAAMAIRFIKDIGNSQNPLSRR